MGRRGRRARRSWRDHNDYALTLERVAADGGDVFITGSADSAKSLEAIAEVAGRVPGVAHVDNEVGVGGHWQW